MGKLRDVSKTDYGTQRFYSLSRRGIDHFKEKKHCAVIAVAVVARITYDEAWHALKAEKRRRNCGTSPAKIEAALDKLGYRLEHVKPEFFTDRYPERGSDVDESPVFYGESITINQVYRFSDAWKDGETYLLYSFKHVTAVMYGEVHDWARNSQKRAKSIYRVVRK